MCGSVEFGVPGVALEPGDHVCALYLGESERDEILLPYLRAGLGNGDRCIAVVESTAPGELIARVGAEDPAVAGLDVRSADETYLRSGGFSAERMLAFWDDYLAWTLGEDDTDFVRATGEMCWALRDPSGAEELTCYEAELNRLSDRRSQCLLCLYDLRLFGGGILGDLLKTHPKVLFGGVLLENPHYLGPDEFLSARA